MSEVLYSIDGGLTYLPVTENIRVIYKDCYNPDEVSGESTDLHINLSLEGIILDVIGTETAESIQTNSFDLDDLVEMTK